MTQTMKVVSVVIGLNGSNCVGKLVSEIKANKIKNKSQQGV